MNHPPIHERILQARGHQPTRSEDGEEPAYQAFKDSGGHPQTGFTLYLRGGGVHLFQYSHIDNVEFRIKERAEYIWLTHRGKSVVLRGRNLMLLMEKLQDYTLKSLHEYDETAGYYEEAPMIDRAHVENANPAVEFE